MIIKIGTRNPRFLLYSRDGRMLGDHKTIEGAKRQERAINISKARLAGHRIPALRKLAR